MLKKGLRFAAKAAAAVVSFALIFLCLQPFFIPKYINYDAETTVLVNGYRQLAKNSVDVLFLGSSQMFRTVDANRLTTEYGISACDYGASGQSISITPYYFKEALKTQSPKLAVLEVGCIFDRNSDLTEREIAWNYAPTPLTREKIVSLKQVLGDTAQAYTHALFPLLIYHDRWRTLNSADTNENKHDVAYVLHPERYNSLYPRGFVPSDAIEAQDPDAAKRDVALKEIPPESVQAIDEIERICSERNIRLLCFKAPAAAWTRGEAESVKRFAEERGLAYFDLNDRYEALSLDPAADFADKVHLNTAGAEKVTDLLADLLPAYLA